MKRAYKKKIAATKTAGMKKVYKKVTKRASILKVPSGYGMSGGILKPTDLCDSDPVPASKIKSGLRKAKNEIQSLLQEIVGTMQEAYVIKEIELTASFDAQGKFMGFGVGGAASIKITIAPEDK